MESNSPEGADKLLPPQHRSSRRDFLKFAASTGATALAAYGALRATGVIPPSDESIPEPTLTPELRSGKPAEFGFNTHLYAEPGENNNLNLERYKKDVDFMVANNMQQIRLNIWPWESVTSGTPTNVAWNEKNMAIYDDAINYAVDTKGMTMCLVSNVPEYGKDYSTEDYLALTKTYYTDLAKRYKGKGLTYQIFDEPDLHRFRDDAEMEGISDAYIGDFKNVIAQAHDPIKAVDPNARVTININKWRDAGVSLVEKGTRIFDAIKDYVDIITLDLYPFDNLQQIEDIPKFIAYFKARYNKPVVIGELGMPSEGYADFSLEKQAEFIPKAITAIKNAPVQPEAVLLYEITDWASADSAAEQNYGLKEPDGTPKKALEPVLEAIRATPNPS